MILLAVLVLPVTTLMALAVILVILYPTVLAVTLVPVRVSVPNVKVVITLTPMASAKPALPLSLAVVSVLAAPPAALALRDITKTKPTLALLVPLVVLPALELLPAPPVTMAILFLGENVFQLPPKRLIVLPTVPVIPVVPCRLSLPPTVLV
jgi:hypothetical protein